MDDCVYLALARAADDVLCTADGALARAVRADDAARARLLGEQARSG